MLIFGCFSLRDISCCIAFPFHCTQLRTLPTLGVRQLASALVWPTATSFGKGRFACGLFGPAKAVASCPDPTSASSKQAGHRLGLDQFSRLVEVVVDDRIGRDAEGVVDGRQKLVRVYRVLLWGRALASLLPCTCPRLMPAPPMIAV